MKQIITSRWSGRSLRMKRTMTGLCVHPYPCILSCATWQNPIVMSGLMRICFHL